jgi:hypothetical protein
LKDDYEREIRRQQSLQNKKASVEEKDLPEKKPTSKKCGKQVPQLGTQKKQLIPPLIVKAAPSDTSFRADMDMGMDPAILAAARAQQMTVTTAKERAAKFSMTLHAVLGLEDVSISEVAFTYVPKGPLVEPG